MKYSLLVTVLFLISASNGLAAGQVEAKCKDQAIAAAVAADSKMFGVEANACGSKELHVGSELETYLVCVTDETEPSEWIVVVKRDAEIKRSKKNVRKSCVVDYTGYTVGAGFPDFLK